MRFSNKVVLITGASAGIGASTALAFAKEDASLVLVGRNENNLKKVAEECSQHGSTPLLIVADVSKDEDAVRIIKDTTDRYGKLDILVNNAGLAVLGTIMNGNVVAAYDEIMAINVRALIQLTTLAAPHLIKTKGNIVNVSSIVGKKVRTSGLAYSVSKAAVDHFTRGSALELSASGVRVNSVSPGPTRTGFFDVAKMSVNADSLASAMPLKRSSDPEEIASLIMYLASDEARGITGSDFLCDNGALLT